MTSFDLPLPGGISPGLVITIDGEPVPGGDRFKVDFIKGSDVVFHFNPRFAEQIIARNSNLDGCWGSEEREGGFPFVEGQSPGSHFTTIFEILSNTLMEFLRLNSQRSAIFVHLALSH
uniref:Galectin n=1 Tax=Sander lucioperca TaxID=283035 RepID=A0A8C9Y9Z8_SANLU